MENKVIKLKRVIEQLTEGTKSGRYRWDEDQIEDHVSSYGITLNCPKTKKREGDGYLINVYIHLFQVEMLSEEIENHSYFYPGEIYFELSLIRCKSNGEAENIRGIAVRTLKMPSLLDSLQDLFEQISITTKSNFDLIEDLLED